ncbi:MAG: hypothetical protein KBC62_02575 [Candidatus Pacebacteria bacterium]|nr:hypothetical protein [Candidatus Paceibacterota bacterium]
MVKAVMRNLLNVPSESTADATLSMEHEWPELKRFISLENLSRIYNFDFITLEQAARELFRRGFLEKRERQVKSMGKIGCSRTVTFYRRTQTTIIIYTRQ